MNRFNGFFLLMAAVLAFSQAEAASGPSDVVPDAENCLLCHRYPAMGRFDKTGRKRILYVNETRFQASVHGKLTCKSCHTDINEIPHTDVRKVDCATECHIKEPSAERTFSHAGLVEKFRGSVHGDGKGLSPKPYPDDLPNCTYCHENTMYLPQKGGWGSSQALADETLAKCMGCHPKDDWARKYYSHFSNRLRRVRSQEEIVSLCTSCHEDRDKMTRHGLESVETYKDTFHWTQVKYGVANAPDCLSCHVPIGFTPHEIRPRTDPVAPTNIANRISTCSNPGGLQVCHPGATTDFAGGRVHAYGLKARMLSGGLGPEKDDPALSMVLQRAQTDMGAEEVFRYRVLSSVRLFYKVFIAGVIGFMVLHQSLDFIAARRSRRKKCTI